MKYWNKDRNVRRATWSRVTVAPPTLTEILTAMKELKAINGRQTIKYWCQAQQSTGKFYNHYSSDTWWFELEEDAAWFALNWT
jgi:hypothetical protein